MPATLNVAEPTEEEADEITYPSSIASIRIQKPTPRHIMPKKKHLPKYETRWFGTRQKDTSLESSREFDEKV